MKKTSLILLVLLSFLSFAQNETRASDSLLKNLIQQKQVIGASAAYSIDGEVKWQSAIGFSDKESEKEFTLNTEVRTASIAKPMTAIAVMQLVEKGLIDINLPIDTYIPEFIQKHKTKITTKHILSHTSGIDAYKNLKEIRNKTHYKTLLDAYAIFKNRKLLFKPGTQFHYTSYGYVVLGILIEKVSGQPYESYMQEHIWNKANMTHTGIEKFGAKREFAATLYHKDKKGRIKKANINDLSNRIPGGGFYSTVGDLIEFGNAILDNTLIKGETLGIMKEHHSLEKYNNGYGFGFYLYGQKPNDEADIFGHNGAQAGTSTQLYIIPSRKIVTVAISNTSGAGRDISTIAGKLTSIAIGNN